VSSRKAREVETSLVKKGFSLVDTHHRIFWFYHNGKKTQIRTRLSQGRKDVDDHLMGCMSRQMKLTRGELDSFVDCSMSGEEYREKMVQARHVVP
jgi:hypothetical protein